MKKMYFQRIKNSTVAMVGSIAAAVAAAKSLMKKEEPRKEVVTMKKSTFAAILIFLSAAVGALVAAYMYIQRREKELDEYEQLLFSEEFNQTVPSNEEVEETEEAHEVPAPVVEDETEIEE